MNAKRIVVVFGIVLIVLSAAWFFGPKNYSIGEWGWVQTTRIKEYSYIEGVNDCVVGVYYTRYDGQDGQAQYSLSWPNPKIVESGPIGEDMRVVVETAPVYREFLLLSLEVGEATRHTFFIVNSGVSHPSIVPLQDQYKD